MEAFPVLLRLYLQTLGISLLFAGTGHFIYRKLFPASTADPLSLRWARGYFLGLCAFLPVFMVLSRLLGAHVTLWIAMAVMAVLSALELRGARQRSAAVFIIIALFLLVAVYSVTNAALWLAWTLPRSSEPSLFLHFGSIHAGRYANYAIFIADHDRVPYLAQNGGQSMLAAVHLLLGVDSPLGALMVWIPFSLAFLSLLLFGLFRAEGFALGPCIAAAFMVMFCNVAVSAVHVLVFDNGSPLALIGYTDMVVAVATFIILCRWLQAQLLSQAPPPRRDLALPALLGVAWSWCAPQNIVLVAAGGLVALLGWRRKYPAIPIGRRIASAAVVLVLAVAVGATQFGTFLPKPLREDTGYWTQDVDSSFAIRPYIQYLQGGWNTEVAMGIYEFTYARAKPAGLDEVYRRLAWVFEQNLWESFRIYGFPILGLVLMAFYVRRIRTDPGGRHDAWQAWWLLSLGSFGCGYLLYFTVELAQMKWWLSRFLVPGSAMAMTCLALAALAWLEGRQTFARRAWWTVLVGAATVGPLADVVAAANRNFVVARQTNPIGERLAVLAHSTGPYLFEGLLFQPESVGRDASGFFVVDAEGHRPGLALYTPAMPIVAGTYRVGYRIAPAGQPAAESRLMDLDVVADAGKPTLARRAIFGRDLERRADGLWAWLDFEVPRESTGVQLRLSSEPHAVFTVTDIRLQRRDR